MTFRDRLLASLTALRPVLEVEGVLIIGSAVPNLLQHGSASTLVVSQDVDVGVPVSQHAAVKKALTSVEGLEPSPEEPSVWLPTAPGLIEVNFVGMDPSIDDAADTYVLEDDVLPLLVFGQLSLMRPGAVVEVDGARVPLPRAAGVMLEKLLTDRSGEKGERDLLVVLGVLLEAGEDDLQELEDDYIRAAYVRMREGETEVLLDEPPNRGDGYCELRRTRRGVLPDSGPCIPLYRGPPTIFGLVLELQASQGSGSAATGDDDLPF